MNDFQPAGEISKNQIGILIYFPVFGKSTHVKWYYKLKNIYFYSIYFNK